MGYILYILTIFSLFTETSFEKARIVSLISNDTISVDEKKFYLAQAKLESGNFKKVKHNNFFGLKYHGRLMRFKSIESCYNYRKRLTIKHGGLYSKRYCPEKTYLRKVKSIMKEKWLKQIENESKRDTSLNRESESCNVETDSHL